MSASTREKHTLHGRLRGAFRSAEHSGNTRLGELAEAVPLDERDELLALSMIHDLSIAPLGALCGAERWQHHPVVASLKQRLESRLLDSLAVDDERNSWFLPDGPVAAMRAIAARDRVPTVYEWLANDASIGEAIEFLALEGGPDSGFDDLVAASQIGLDGMAKVEMASNYWDEMGNGSPDRVHRELYLKFAQSVDLPTLKSADQPVEGLRRTALTGTLATNRRLQPEMIGYLGMIEMQAGPRCRKVVTALERLGADADAMDFYREHALADPLHGKNWLDRVVSPLAEDTRFAIGIVRGARWRSLINRHFFDALEAKFLPSAPLKAMAS